MKKTQVPPRPQAIFMTSLLDSFVATPRLHGMVRVLSMATLYLGASCKQRVARLVKGMKRSGHSGQSHLLLSTQRRRCWPAPTQRLGFLDRCLLKLEVQYPLSGQSTQVIMLVEAVACVWQIPRKVADQSNAFLLLTNHERLEGVRVRGSSACELEQG